MGSPYVENVLEDDSIRFYQWDEIVKHTTGDDKWLVLNGCVYDISQWQHKHPGGARIISHFAGQDATDAWVAMHKDHNLVSKYLKSMEIGKVSSESTKATSCRNVVLERDFRELRDLVEKSGLLKSKSMFYALHLVHIIVLEVLAYMLVRWFNGDWISVITSCFILATAQGASSHWWNFRHNQHHSKPNIIRKDPDIGAAYLFVVGEEMPLKFAKKGWGFMPYDWQHIYFWLLGPPTLLPFYFHFENIYFMFKRRDWKEFFICMTFFCRFGYLYGSILGPFWTYILYMSMRFIESHWFVMVTQMNHIPMTVDFDHDLDWVSTQAAATCNVQQSLFNDWFTGHLNFQIEHHLFPTMPRHNYVRVQPLVKSLFNKHGIKYVEKSLLNGMADIITSLKASGQLWRKTYDDCWTKNSQLWTSPNIGADN